MTKLQSQRKEQERKFGKLCLSHCGQKRGVLAESLDTHKKQGDQGLHKKDREDQRPGHPPGNGAAGKIKTGAKEHKEQNEKKIAQVTNPTGYLDVLKRIGQRQT